MAFGGTVCKVCGEKYHICSSCGVEEWYYDYCSFKCLEKDGKIICPICRGWSYGHEDNDPEDLLDLPSCTGYVEKQ